MSTVTYNRVIRKITTAFGDIFNNITFVRYNADMTEQQRMLVPIEYATKELYVKRLQEDPDLNKKVQITLPRMSYALNGISYDRSRKQNTNQKNFTNTNNGVSSQYSPVPYDLDYSLQIYVRNIEDGMQIVENILPYFTPDYTVKLNLIPELGIIKDIPFVLNSTNYEVEYEGNRDTATRVVIWTLNFTAKAYIFGNASTSSSLIRNSITNIIDDSMAKSSFVFNMANDANGTFKENELVYQGKSLSSATATARVISYINNKLYLQNLIGNFLANSAIIGSSTGARQTFVSYQTQPIIDSQIVITPRPTDANANDTYGYTTTITETPNVNSNVVTTYGLFGDLTSNAFGYDDLDQENGNIVDLGQ
jgi:hypothetical protein